MWRTLLKPRWLLLLALLVVVVAAFTRLGLWQLSVAQDDAAEQARAEQLARPVVPLTEALDPHRPFPADAAGRPVTATGSYAGDLQFLVPDRVLDGAPGYWVVTPLVVQDTGANLTVVRGFVSDPADADRPPARTVTVTGTLAPGEAPEVREDLPEGQRDTVDLSVLANDWPGELYNAFVFATAEEPQVTDGAVLPIPPPSFGGEVDWRNFGYALQWWVFAAFGIFMFIRFVRDDHEMDRAQAQALAAEDPAPRHTVGEPGDPGGSPVERTQSHHV